MSAPYFVCHDSATRLYSQSLAAIEISGPQGMDSRRHEGGADVTMEVSDMVGVEITAVVMEAKNLGGKGVEGTDNNNEEMCHM